MRFRRRTCPCCGGRYYPPVGFTGYCCGCDRELPLGFFCTVSIPCIGTRTIELEIDFGSHTCYQPGDFIDAYTAWSGSYTNGTPSFGIDTPTPCGSLTPILEAIPVTTREDLTVVLRCNRDPDTGTFQNFTVYVDWYKRTMADEPRRIKVGAGIDLLDCSPANWSGSYTLSCCDTTGVTITTFGQCSYYDSCVGDTLTVDISE